MSPTATISKFQQHFTKNPIGECQLQEKITNEEYKIWKKTVPLLYQTIQLKILPYSSPVFEWLSNGVTYDASKNHVSAKFLLAKNSPSNDEYVGMFQLGEVELPATLASHTKHSVPIPSGPPDHSKLRISNEWKHDDLIEIIRINPKSRKLATFGASSGDISIYDFLVDSSSSSNNPIKLKYHKKPGTALEWKPSDQNVLISGSRDATIALWDISSSSAAAPVSTITSTSPITDLSWNHHYPHIFAASSQSPDLEVYDINNPSTPIYHIPNAHKSNCYVTSVEFHSSISTMLATGGTDNVINLWDLRYCGRPFRTLFGPADSISQLKFHPNNANILTSVSDDRRVYIWDMNEISAGDYDEEIRRDIGEEGEDPCLKFIHGGHTGKINDISISSELVDVYGSVGEDGSVEVWKPFYVEQEEDNYNDSDDFKEINENKEEENNDDKEEEKEQNNGNEEAGGDHKEKADGDKENDDQIPEVQEPKPDHPTPEKELDQQMNENHQGNKQIETDDIKDQ
ncbi:transcriptional modulator [Saccharomycopsis crataegensis]|uniref:Transcriptional modulator n=1 Tax=Saccharomycopsis crataegensis TaxID=43959 RepID=A0AAV5QNR1_9ASCO|nr:transcriptional modulator [Saccharomycopsis crataegensis]